MDFNIEIKLHHKKMLVCAAMVIVGTMITKSEQYIIDHVVIGPPVKDPYRIRAFETCPTKSKLMPIPFNSQYSKFYWSSNHVYKVRKYSKALPYIISGVLADKYGGQRLILLSLVISSSVMAVRYLTVLQSSTVFLVMITVRRFGEGVRKVAWVSLAMQWSRPSRRTTFVGAMLASEEFGYIVGSVVPKLLGQWQHSYYFFSLAGFLTAGWWWVVCSKPEYRFATNSRATIPWRRVFNTRHFYILCLLLISSENIHFLQSSILYYLRQVVRFHPPSSLYRHLFTLLVRSAGIFGSLYVGVASDFLISKRLVAVSTVRKFFFVTTFPWVVLAVLVITFIPCSVHVALACVVVMQCCSLLFFVNVITIIINSAPLFATTMFGLTYFFGSEIGVTGELLLTNYLKPENWVSLRTWKPILYIVTFSMIFTVVPYLTLSRSQEPTATERNTEAGNALAQPGPDLVQVQPSTSKDPDDL